MKNNVELNLIAIAIKSIHLLNNLLFILLTQILNFLTKKCHSRRHKVLSTYLVPIRAEREINRLL